MFNEHGFLVGTHYRSRNAPDSDQQKRQCALTFNAPVQLKDGQAKALSLGIGELHFDQAYARLIGTIAGLYDIHPSSSTYREMLTTLPAFKAYYGIECDHRMVTVRDYLRYDSNRELGMTAQLKPIDMQFVLTRHPALLEFVNEEQTLLKYLSCTQANEQRGSLLSVNFRKKGNDLPNVTTTLAIGSFEESYLKACKKIASIVGLDHDREVIKALYATHDNFKRFYGLTSERVVEQALRWVTTSASERSMAKGHAAPQPTR